MERSLKLVLLAGTLLLLIPGTLMSQASRPARPYSEPNLLQDFLCSEVQYPDASRDTGQEGTVVLEFIVGSDGKVSNLKVKESVNPELDAEAIRLFRMILWEPAVSLGQPVASSMEFPVKFNIKKYEKHCKQRGYDRTTPPFEPIDSSGVVYDLNQLDKAPYPVFSEKGMTLPAFIIRNIKYPETAYRQNLFGKVTLQFVIEPHGRPSNIKVIQPVGGGCTQEAIRLLELLKWMPGLKGGLAVRTMNKIDIEFKLPDDSNVRMFENTQMNSN